MQLHPGTLLLIFISSLFQVLKEYVIFFTLDFISFLENQNPGHEILELSN